MSPVTFFRTCLLPVLALGCAAGLSAQDMDLPQIVSASISPPSVEVGASRPTVTVTLKMTDDDSYFYYGSFYLYNAAGKYVTGVGFYQFQPTGSDPIEGTVTYSKTLTVPQYSVPGTWRVDVSLMDDEFISLIDYGPNAEPLPDPAAMTFTVTNGGEIDSTSPRLIATSAAPATVSNTGGSGTVTITVECSDTPGGFVSGSIYLKDPHGYRDYDLSTYFSSAQRIAGDEFSGTYKVPVTIPEGRAAGQWTYEVDLRDRVLNSGTNPGGSFEVISTPPPASFLAQALDAVQFDWSSSGAGWILTTSDSSDGVDAAVSRPVADDGEAVLQTTVTGPGTLSFQWQVASEKDADLLSVSVPSASLHQQISGNTSWAPVSLSIPAGEHLVVWRYAKNSSVATGRDCGWVDQVRFQAASDHEPPRLQALRVDPRIMGYHSWTQELIFTVEVTDDFNGLEKGHIELFDPMGVSQASATFYPSDVTSGDAMTGTYDVILEISDNPYSGTWRTEITLTEAVSGATRHYGPAAERFPTIGAEFLPSDYEGEDDTVAPLLRALEVSPGGVDVSAGPASATVTLQIADAGFMGFNTGYVSLYTESGEYFSSFSLNQLSGDTNDGIYQAEITVPRYAAPGTWRVGCELWDYNENLREYPADQGFPAGVNETFTVANSGPIDLDKPVMTELNLTPTQLDTSAASAQIQVTFTILDDLAGVRTLYLIFYDPAGESQDSLFTSLTSGLTRISGDAREGTYRATKTLPQGSAEGQWTVGIYVSDHTGKTSVYSYSPSSAPYPPSSNGKFTVGDAVAPPLFDAFMASHALTGADALPGADPDHDGLNNATELMLGTNPTSATSAAGLITLIRDATHLHLRFTIAPALTVSAAGKFLELRDGSGGSPLRVTGQTQAAGLAGTWVNTLPVLVSGSTYQISLPFAGGPSAFARLSFETP